MKKLIISLWVFSLLIGGFSFQTVFAGESSGLELGTLIPTTTEKDSNFCRDALNNIDKQTDPSYYFKHPEEVTNTYKNDILSCAIQTGRIHMWMIPYYVVYLIQFLIGIAGLLAVLFLVIGGFQYVASGLSANKDNAKKTITNALLGLAVALSAWALVNLVQYLITI